MSRWRERSRGSVEKGNMRTRGGADQSGRCLDLRLRYRERRVYTYRSRSILLVVRVIQPSRFLPVLGRGGTKMVC